MDKPELIYNVDESGMPLEQQSSRVITKKRKKKCDTVLLSEGSQNLPFWLTFFSVSFNFLYIDVVMYMFVVICLASHVCCLYLKEAPLYRQSLLVFPVFKTN